MYLSCADPTVGWLSIPLSGLLVLFFRGLLELSKSFLDPFGNESVQVEDDGDSWSPSDDTNDAVRIRTDTLINEVNYASTRFWRGAEVLPFDTLQSQMAAEGQVFNGRLAGAGLETMTVVEGDFPDDCAPLD